MDITIIIAKLKEEMKKLFATKEDVPTKTSDLINDNDFITNSDVSGKENISNKVTNWSNTPSNDNYPSEKLVKDSLDGLDSAITTGLDGKVDKVTGKGLSSNDFTDEYKGYVDAYTDCNEEHITYYYNMEYTDGLSHSPLVIEQVGRVFHLHGTWKTSSSISIRTQASKQLGYFSSPAPNYPIYSPQLITNGGLYEIMVSPNRKIELTNVSKSSDLTIPANTVCYVNIMWVLDW